MKAGCFVLTMLLAGCVCHENAPGQAVQDTE